MKDYFLQPTPGMQARYLRYLVERLTQFRKAGKSFGQKSSGEISIGTTWNILKAQLGNALTDPAQFDHCCQFIKEKIDDTILGRRNAAHGRASYHSFNEHGQTKPKFEQVSTPHGSGAAAVQQRHFPTTKKDRSKHPPSCNITTRDASSQSGVSAPVATALHDMGQEPTPAEIAWLWHTAFGTVEQAVKAGKSETKAKRSVIRHLSQHASFLSRNECALRWNFNRKFRQWKLQGRKAGAVMDGRIEANAKRRVELPVQDRDKIIAKALFQHGGDVAPAVRDCLERGELSPNISQRYLLNPSRTSHIPEAIAREVVPEVKLLLPHFHGPRQARLNGAYIERDWSNVGAGDWYSSDDFTLEVYAYLSDGKGWLTLSRCQFLPMIDERSKRILDFVLVAEKNYTGINVRTLINKVCSRYGLPRHGFFLENGLWRKSQLVGGAVSVGEVKTNFAERLGIRIEHARAGNARAKIIENAGKLFQARLRGEPGWVGSNEQVLKIEHVQRAKLDVEARRKHPAEAGFLSFDQWAKRLAELCEEYNTRPQDSKVMGGTMSPNEAWRLLQTRDDAGQVVPLCKLPEDCRYLLASHTRRMRIGRNGIRLPESLGGGSYRNEITGQLQGREVTVYFDLELPEMISITEDRRQVFTVPRAATCPAHNATPDELAAAQRSVSAHTQYARQRISQLRSEYMPPIRANLVDPQTSALGREMKAQQTKTLATQQARKRRETHTRNVAEDIGVPRAAIADVKAAERLKKALANEPD